MSSSEGSYTLFGSQSSLERPYTPFQSPKSSPNSSLQNLEFEFTGFESTCGISSLPFFEQQNLPNSTMASTDGLSSPSEEPNMEEVEPSEGWKKFHNLATYMIDSINLEVRALSTQLLDPSVNQSVMQINTRAFSTNRFRTKLSSLEDDLKEAIFHETYPQQQLQEITNTHCGLIL